MTPTAPRRPAAHAQACGPLETIALAEIGKCGVTRGLGGEGRTAATPVVATANAEFAGQALTAVAEVRESTGRPAPY